MWHCRVQPANQRSQWLIQAASSESDATPLVGGVPPGDGGVGNSDGGDDGDGNGGAGPATVVLAGKAIEKLPAGAHPVSIASTSHAALTRS